MLWHNGWPNLGVFQLKIICIVREIIRQNFSSLGSVVSAEFCNKQKHTLLTYCCFRGLIKYEEYISVKDIYLDFHCSIQQSLFFSYIHISFNRPWDYYSLQHKYKKKHGALPPPLIYPSWKHSIWDFFSFLTQISNNFWGFALSLQ